MAILPYLNFQGNCREAVEFYARVFNTERPQFQTFGEMPPDPSYTPPDEVKNLIMHTRLNISGTQVMFSDTPPGMPFKLGNNVALTMVSNNRHEIVNAYNALSEGGRVDMPLQETFWTKLFGSVTDRYGVEWQFNLDSGETWP
jgi:PhnB protein